MNFRNPVGRKAWIALCMASFLICSSRTFAEDAPAAKAPDANEKAMYGSWDLKSFHYTGEVNKEWEGTRFIITKGRLVIRDRFQKYYSWTLTTDTSKDPNQYDMKMKRRAKATLHNKGIFKIEGDKLTLCLSYYGQPRPRRFQTREGDGLGLMVFQRVKEDAKKEKSK